MTYNGVSGLPLYYRGARNFDAVIDDLRKRFGLATASVVVLSGDSAGGLATYHHADRLSQLLPGVKTVVAVPDSGFFFAAAGYSKAWPDALAAIAFRMNSTSALNPLCVSAHGVSCMLPEIAAPFITTPLFVMNSRYDPAGNSIVTNGVALSAAQVNGLGDEMLALVRATVLARAPNAAFLTSCHEHCGQWGSGQEGLFPDFNVTIDGSAITAFASWLTAIVAGEAPPRTLWLQAAPYPCPGCCRGGPTAPVTAPLTLLSAAAANAGAVCLDGSPAGVYVDLASSRGLAPSSSWVVYQQGGERGGCEQRL